MNTKNDISNIKQNLQNLYRRQDEKREQLRLQVKGEVTGLLQGFF
jgi:hypothetical protein